MGTFSILHLCLSRKARENKHTDTHQSNKTMNRLSCFLITIALIVGSGNAIWEKNSVHFKSSLRATLSGFVVHRTMTTWVFICWALDRPTTLVFMIVFWRPISIVPYTRVLISRFMQVLQLIKVVVALFVMVRPIFGMLEKMACTSHTVKKLPS